MIACAHFVLSLWQLSGNLFLKMPLKTSKKDPPSPHSLKDERCSKRIRHSLRSCRLCRFFLLLLRDIDHADEVPPDDQGLLFCPCAGDFLRFLHLDLLHERSDDLCGKFRNVRIPAHHSQEGTTFRRCSRASAIAVSSSETLVSNCFCSVS